jgi:hypothetical protein
MFPGSNNPEFDFNNSLDNSHIVSGQQKNPFQGPVEKEEQETQRMGLPSLMQTGNFLGKLSQLFMRDDEKDKAAFENLESLGNTQRLAN